MIGSEWQTEACLLSQLTKASRYNLKRRVASLPPLSSEIFAEKVLSAQANSSAAAAKASFEKGCAACQKTFYSENAYQNHLGSQKHRFRLATLKTGEIPATTDETDSVISSTFSLGEPINTAKAEAKDREAEAEFSKVVDSMKETNLEEEPVSRRPSRPHHSAEGERPEHPLSHTTTNTSISEVQELPEAAKTPISRCLFCNYDSPSLKLSVCHMTRFHGLFIPEQSYLVDLEGLIAHLQHKVNEFHECLLCHKIKSSTVGVQTHMRDKGHCMIAFDSEEEMVEVGQYYDFGSTYSDSDEDDMDADERNVSGGGVKLGSRRSEALKTVVQDVDGDVELEDGDENNGDGWETDSSASSLDSAEITAVPIDHDHAYQRLPLHRHHSHTDPRPHHAVDGFHSHAHSHHAVFYSDHELHLPSGRTAGHRSLSRYYRQNLHSYPTLEERVNQRMLTDGAASSSDENGTVQSREGRSRQLATRANGGSGMLGVTDSKKREVKASEKRDRHREQRVRGQYQWGVEKRGNNQKHYRDPLLQ